MFAEVIGNAEWMLLRVRSWSQSGVVGVLIAHDDKDLAEALAEDLPAKVDVRRPGRDALTPRCGRCPSRKLSGLTVGALNRQARDRPG